MGNGQLAEQFAVHRRGFAISAHIAGGNVPLTLWFMAGAFVAAAVASLPIRVDARIAEQRANG